MFQQLLTIYIFYSVVTAIAIWRRWIEWKRYPEGIEDFSLSSSNGRAPD